MQGRGSRGGGGVHPVYLPLLMSLRAPFLVSFAYLNHPILGPHAIQVCQPGVSSCGVPMVRYGWPFGGCTCEQLPRSLVTARENLPLRFTHILVGECASAKSICFVVLFSSSFFLLVSSLPWEEECHQQDPKIRQDQQSRLSLNYIIIMLDCLFVPLMARRCFRLEIAGPLACKSGGGMGFRGWGKD